MKNSGFQKAVDDAVRRELIDRDLERILSNKIIRMQTLDKVTITLGLMGLTPDQLAQFEDEYKVIESKYSEQIINDADPKGNNDKELLYSKGDIDNSLKRFVREDRFANYDERFGLSQSDIEWWNKIQERMKHD